MASTARKQPKMQSAQVRRATLLLAAALLVLTVRHASQPTAGSPAVLGDQQGSSKQPPGYTRISISAAGAVQRLEPCSLATEDQSGLLAPSTHKNKVGPGRAFKSAAAAKLAGVEWTPPRGHRTHRTQPRRRPPAAASS